MSAGAPCAAFESADPYQRHWSAQAYLDQYYRAPELAEDTRAIFGQAIPFMMNTRRRFSRLLEFGCGPTVHHLIPFVPYVGQIHLCDYVSDNLDQVRKWAYEEPDAHPWDSWVRGALQMEEHLTGRLESVAQRIQQMRGKVKNTFVADLRSLPSALTQSYDLVTSFFCVECVAATKHDWETLMSNLTGLIEPGGVMVLTAMRRCRQYKVFGKHFPSVPVDETDFARVLPSLGFEPARTEIHSIPVAEWAEEGFDGICVVMAEKTGA